MNNTWRIPVKTPSYVMLSSDYSAQEPRITAYVSQDPKMIQAFKDGRDIYGSIASVAFGLPYEQCLEFHPETGSYQPDGKARRTEAKSIVLGRLKGLLPWPKACAPSLEIYFYRLMSENIVNYITHRCISYV